MSDKPESKLKGKDVKYYYWAVYELSDIDNGDTVTLDEFTTAEHMKKTVMMRKSNGTEITLKAPALNVAEVNDATASNDAVVLFAYGRKA